MLAPLSQFLPSLSAVSPAKRTLFFKFIFSFCFLTVLHFYVTIYFFCHLDSMCIVRVPSTRSFVTCCVVRKRSSGSLSRPKDVAP